MRQYFEIIIVVLLTTLLLLTIYRMNDLSYKLQRVRRRYDKLLRGRGELNMEELLAEQASDIEVTKSKMKEIEQLSARLEGEFSEKSTGITARLTNDIFNIDKNLSDRLNILEKEHKANFDSLAEKLETSLANLSTKQEREISQIVSSNKEFKNDISTSTDKMMKLMNEKLAFAVQKQILHKYNALENQSGDLSFTMILLDQFNNGIMFTSINGRESSYAYAKNIKNGECEYECSPEEQEALNKLLGK